MRKGILSFVANCLALAGQGYQKPPKAVLDVLNAPGPPEVWVSPDGAHAAVGQRVRMPSIADVARPYIGLAGIRIDAANNNARLLTYISTLSVKDLVTGKAAEIRVPADARLEDPVWSPDGKHIAIANAAAGTLELFVIDAETGELQKQPGVALNGIFGNPFTWISGRELLVRTIPENRPAPPKASAVPSGPVIQESHGQSGPVRTNPDMITNPHDADLFDYYGTSQIVILDIASRSFRATGMRGVYSAVSMSPDGKYLLVERLTRPYSYLHPWRAFAHNVAVWNRKSGGRVYDVAQLPLADKVPIEGVPAGPRNLHWFATEPATLLWIEAVDGGDPRKPAQYRDRVVRFRAPFGGEPVEVARTEQRIRSWSAVEGTTLVAVDDYDRSKRWVRDLLIDIDKPGEAPRQISGRNMNDRYRDPGLPVFQVLANGHTAIKQRDGHIWLHGQGATPAGDRPFLDKLALADFKTTRVHQSGEKDYDEVVALASADGSRYVVRRESSTDPPNFFLYGSDGRRKPITAYADPTPQLRRVTKQLVRYKRNDGVDLQFTLYLPPDYKKGTALPTVVEAYPTEFTDADTAGQVVGSAQRFTILPAATHLYYVLAGYAVLDNTSMPVIGNSDTVNNTYVEQITASAKAAIQKAAEMGVTDPARVGVIGHSYGAFMTANLLAHTDLFRAGVARSGAYNRTLTPFGFQNERRTYWEAPEIYTKMSPFTYANKINEPILFIHGQADDNQGTFTIQSERMYQAVRGNGGTTRLVLLPHEAHAYRARESIEHTLYEMISWFDTYVKPAKPVPNATSISGSPAN